MKRTKLWLTTMAMSTIMSATSFADDKLFDGLLVGGELGASFVDFGQVHQSGLYYGGLIGYRKQTSDNWVYGIEGTLADTNQSIEGSSSFGSIFELDFKYQWSAAATMGKTFGSNNTNLIFGKLGYNRYKYSFEFPDQIVPPANIPSSQTQGGILLGVGYERSMNNSLSLRVGVDYADGEDLHQWQPKASVIIKF